jgi:hypothetical protein
VCELICSGCIYAASSIPTSVWGHRVSDHISKETEMITNTRTSRRLAAGCFAAAVVAGLAAAAPAAGMSHPAHDDAGAFDAASLPRTPDAVQGWYAQHRAQQELRQWSPDQVDSSLMIRQDYTSWLTNPFTAPWAETTETRAANPPANWRRLMDEVAQVPPPVLRPAPGDLSIDAEHRRCFRLTCGDFRRTTDEQLDSIRKDQVRIREAFQRGVGPGRSL